MNRLLIVYLLIIPVMTVLIMGSFWVHLGISFVIWTIGAAVLFSLMRTFILARNLRGFVLDLFYSGIAFGLLLFLYPVSLTLAVATFLAVQIFCDLKQSSSGHSFKTDHFYESATVARRVLKG